MSVIRLYSGQRNGRATLRRNWIAIPRSRHMGSCGFRREATDAVSIKKVLLDSSGDCSPIVEKSATARTAAEI
jgi:hypothetical protein